MKPFGKNKREMWVSNNRVLVGGSKKITGRNPNFDTDETRLLISLWGDPKVQKTLITTHKKHAVIARLADKMREYGYQRSAEEINTRIKNLKCFYNRIKKDIDSGSNNEPTWKHYIAMDEIMTRPIFSVRPNEIPKPSLRYKLEEAKREREERGETLDEIEEAELMKTLQGALDNNKNNNSTTRISENDQNDYTQGVTGSIGNGNMKNDSDMEDDDNEISHEDEQNIFDDDVDYEPLRNSTNINHNMNNKLSAGIPLRVTRSRKNDKRNNKEESQASTPQNINQNNMDMEEEALIIKDEPIDVDDESSNDKMKDEDKGSDSYPLADYLKAANNNKSNMSTIITTVAAPLSSTTTSSNSSIKIGQPTSLIGITNGHSMPGHNNCSNTQAKISLVPTNFLLKPQSQNIQQKDIHQHTQMQQQHNHTLKANSLQGIQIANRQIPIRPKPQPRIIYTHQPSAGQQASNGIVNTSNGPMKVLLVNALQKNSQNVQNIVTPSATMLQNKAVEIQNNGLYQPSTSSLQTNISNMSKMQQSNPCGLANGLVSSTSNDKINLIRAQTHNKNALGYKALLGHLIRTQEEANQINRDRLRIEQERFEYEKSIGDRFMISLPNIFDLIHRSQRCEPQQSVIEPEQMITTQSIPGAPIVSAVENSTQNCSLANDQTNVTPENTKDAVPFILLTPKIEKEDD